MNVSEFKKAVLVHVREYYVKVPRYFSKKSYIFLQLDKKSNELKPGKGIALSVDDWKKLTNPENVAAVNEQISLIAQ